MISGGKFLVEIETPVKSKEIGKLNVKTKEKNDGSKIILTSSCVSYDETKNISTFENKYELIKDGKIIETELEEFKVRYFNTEEFKNLLKQVGFKNINTFRPFSNETTIVFECIR